MDDEKVLDEEQVMDPGAEPQEEATEPPPEGTEAGADGDATV